MTYVLLLIGVAAVWGWTFVLVKDAISQYPTVPFLAIRFALGLVVMALMVRRRPSTRALKVGSLVGLSLAAGYLTQTEGLRSTSPGTAGLLTGLYVVFTPALERLLGRPVPSRTVAAVAVALIGTALLTGFGAGGSVLGDLLLIACALCFALQMVLLSRWAPELPSGDLALVQMAACAVVFAALGGPGIHAPPARVWPALAVTGVVASAFAAYVQTWAQSRLTASRTAVILALEPAWALFFSMLLTGQRLTPAQGLGAALVLVAIGGHELLGLAAGVRSPAPSGPGRA